MQPIQDKSEVNLSEYLDVVRRRWIWILLTPVLLVGFTLFRDLRAEPVYAARTQMLLRSSDSQNIFGLNNTAPDPERAIQNELKIINSRPVKDAVTKAYGKPIVIQALAGGEDDVIILAARANTGEKAAERANTYATTYQEVRLDALVEDLTNAKKVVQQQINDFQKQIDAIDAPVAKLDEQLRTLSPTDPRYDALLADRNRVKELTDAARNEARAQLTDYQNRLQVLQLSERLTTTGGVQILNPATVPSAPLSPTITRDVVQSLLIGLFLGLALAFVRDQLDDSIRSKADAERAVKTLPVIGLIPNDTDWRDGRRSQLSTVADPMSAAAEAYRALRTSIQYSAIEEPIKVLQVNSANAVEGKTTLISNLAVAFAQAGERVIVVGCDLRKPRLHQTLQVDGSIGFTSVLLGDVSLEDAIQQSPLHSNVDVLTSGPLPPNPSELLSLERSGRLFRTLGQEYSRVLIDCPPVLPVTDAIVLSRWVDAALFITMANKTTRRQARRAVEVLRQVDSPLLGLAVLGLAAEDTYGSFYEYYGYKTRRGVPFFGRKSYRKGPAGIGLIDQEVADSGLHDDATTGSD